VRWIARPLLVYLACAAVTTWPLVLHPSSLIGAPVGPGDPFLYLWVLGWGMHAVLHDPLSLLNGDVFNGNIFHPAAGTLSFSDHLLLQSVALSPIYAITGDLTLCYNVLLIASLVASALAMHAFVRDVVGSSGGAYIAGLVWGFGSFRFAHLLHIQLQALYFLPLTFLFLHRLMAGRRLRDAILLGVVFGLQAVSSVYYAVIGGVGLVCALLALAIATGRRWNGLLVRRLVLSGVIAGIMALPLAIVYLRVQQSEGFGRTLYEASRSAAYASSYLQVPPGNVVYGRTDLLRDHRAPADGAPPRSGPERELFPGFTIVLLAAAGIWFGRRADARPTVMAMSLLVVVGFVLSLGPDGLRGLYAVLHRYIFGFQAIRAPSRFAVLVMFGLAALAAIGWRELWERRSVILMGRLRWLALAAFAAVAVELLHMPVALAAAPPLTTEIGQWLQHAREPGPVAVLPLTIDVDNTPAMVQSLEHRRPLLNGYSGQRPAFYPSLVDALSAFPSDEALLALLESDVRFVVSPRPVDAGPAPPLVERARFAAGTIYELRWTPEIESRVRAHATVEPVAAGPIPFQAGETAAYTVVWNGAANVTAGTVVTRVEGPPYRFVVSAETAPWIARFYEVHAVLTTTVDDALITVRNERLLREGSRSTNRIFDFDAARGVVRIGQSQEEVGSSSAVVLPLAAHARDAVAALFYVRTLPLTEGARYALPVNEGGRNSIVEFVVRTPESIVVQGRTRQAIRLEPRITHRIERRAAPSATVWLDTDSKHLPLAVEVDAAFGQVRIELTQYEQPAR
jgi:Protein of unknown function (DUF3108)